MSVRPSRPEDLAAVTAMMRALWPTSEAYDFGNESVFVWQRDNVRGLGGFISFSVRPWAEGASWHQCRTSKDGGSIPICEAPAWAARS